MAMEPTQLFQHFVRRPASACAAGTGVLALLALWGRECGNIGFGAGRATIEPASACLMAILGLAIYLDIRYPDSPHARRFAFFAAFATGAVSLFFGMHFLTGFEPAKWEWPGWMERPMRAFFTDHMPPLAAAGFLGAAIALCLELLPNHHRRFYRQTVTLLGLGMFITASLVVVRYAIGTPAYSDPAVMPLALPTAICFALLGLSLSIHSGLDFLDRDLTELQRVEGELQQSVEKQRLYFEQSSLAIIEWDKVFRVTQWNPAAERMFGYTAEEAVGQFVTFLIPPEARNDVKRLLANLMTRQDSLTSTHTLRAKDGRSIVSRWNNTALTDTKGDFLGVVSVCEEITDTTKASEELERLAALVRNSSELIGISDLESKLVFLNEAGCKMVGISSFNVRRHSYMELVADHFHEKAEREILPAVLRGETWRGELQYRNLKIRKLIDVEATIFGICDPATGLPRYLACISLDISDRKRAEDALREKDRKLSLFAANASDFIWSINFAGRATYISPSVKKMLGYDPAEFARFSFKDYLTPDSAKLAMSRLEKAIADQRPGQPLEGDTLELEYRRKDGTTIWTEVHSNGMYDEKGSLIGIQGITRDISKRKRAEDRLRESERRFRLFAENVNGILWEMDFSGSYTYLSPTVEKLLGYAPEEALLFKLGQTMTPESAAAANKVLVGLAEANRDGYPLSNGYFESEHHRKDGSKIWVGVHYSPMYDESGKPVGMQGLTIDISEQRRTQTELAFKNVLLRTQQEVSIDGILAVDPNYKVILRNQRFNEMWHLPPKVSVTEDDHTILHTGMAIVADPPAFLEKVVYIYEHPEVKSRDEILMQDGRVFDRYTAPMYGPDGQHFGRIWFFRDITDGKQAEELLRKSEERYRKLFEEISKSHPETLEILNRDAQ